MDDLILKNWVCEACKGGRTTQRSAHADNIVLLYLDACLITT